MITPKSLISAVPRPDKRLKRFSAMLVTYIEDAEERPEGLNLATHWLGKGARGTQADRQSGRAEGRAHALHHAPFSVNPSRRLFLDAVKDVSFAIQPGEVFGLVGESGSGKSTIARMITGIYKPIGRHHHLRRHRHDGAGISVPPPLRSGARCR